MTRTVRISDGEQGKGNIGRKTGREQGEGSEHDMRKAGPLKELRSPEL